MSPFVDISASRWAIVKEPDPYRPAGAASERLAHLLQALRQAVLYSQLRRPASPDSCTSRYGNVPPYFLGLAPASADQPLSRE